MFTVNEKYFTRCLGKKRLVCGNRISECFNKQNFSIIGETEPHSKHSETSKMELFSKVVNS